MNLNSFSDDSKGLLIASQNQARKRQHARITPVHLLLAFLETGTFINLTDEDVLELKTAANEKIIWEQRPLDYLSIAYVKGATAAEAQTKNKVTPEELVAGMASVDPLFEKLQGMLDRKDKE